MDEKIITRLEYLAALDIVEAYHKQLKDADSKIKLTPINEWGHIKYCSVRLCNVLMSIYQGDSSYKETFIENIDTKKMIRVRHCGAKSLYEFIELRGY